jgi:hypothetical protein
MLFPAAALDQRVKLRHLLPYWDWRDILESNLSGFSLSALTIFYTGFAKVFAC